MMLYHRNRLIKPYLRVGIQQEANRKVRPSTLHLIPIRRCYLP